ncbi:ester cyclase [Mycobacterium terramassiliense]|uniref:Predicted ester cyclase n=1 Tax=Mycobacterium terramassiliense TaxID=1841859 RepID=A0A2U3NGB9_9MYCO|nr:ester cyclase [Mycobacterium terramassiliense]SPM30559.1 Predicted ester cyclase [Mycobacterium terramassiliense]
MTVSCDIVRRHYDILNRAAWDEWSLLLEEDFLVHHASGAEVRGRADYIEGVKLYRASFPDLVVDVHRVIAQDCLLAADFVSRATFSADFLGISANGIRWQLAGMGFYRVEHNRLAEAWFVEDVTGWLNTLSQPSVAASSSAPRLMENTRENTRVRS